MDWQRQLLNWKSLLSFSSKVFVNRWLDPKFFRKNKGFQDFEKKNTKIWQGVRKNIQLFLHLFQLILWLCHYEFLCRLSIFINWHQFRSKFFLPWIHFFVWSNITNKVIDLETLIAFPFSSQKHRNLQT